MPSQHAAASALPDSPDSTLSPHQPGHLPRALHAAVSWNHFHLCYIRNTWDWNKLPKLHGLFSVQLAGLYSKQPPRGTTSGQICSSPGSKNSKMQTQPNECRDAPNIWSCAVCTTWSSLSPAFLPLHPSQAQIYHYKIKLASRNSHWIFLMSFWYKLQLHQ